MCIRTRILRTGVGDSIHSDDKERNEDNCFTCISSTMAQGNVALQFYQQCIAIVTKSLPHKQSNARCVRHSIGNQRRITLTACEKLLIEARSETSKERCTNKAGKNLRLRFLTSSSFVSPELRQAIVVECFD